jgi:serine/threonine-protein kinase
MNTKQLKVTDFGIAKAPGTEGQSTERGLTVAGAIIGTPEYMSPEHIDDAASVTASSDIYALGVCLYEMYTLTCPFEHDSVMQLLRMHQDVPPPPPRDRNPHMPKSLEAVILKCLEKAPADRYASVTELARDLRAVSRELR